MEKLAKSMREFNQVAREIDAAYHTAAIRMDLSDSERDILYILSQGPVSQSDIVNMTGISKQTIHSSVQKMIRDGYISPLAGGKKEQLKLTPEGVAHVKSTVEKLIRAENRVFAGWSEEERESFIALNRKYLEMFKKEIEEF